MHRHCSSSVQFLLLISFVLGCLLLSASDTSAQSTRLQFNADALNSVTLLSWKSHTGDRSVWIFAKETKGVGMDVQVGIAVGKQDGCFYRRKENIN